MNTTIQNSNDLLSFLSSRAEGGNKQWFGFLEQKMSSISLAHQIAANHADKLTPNEIVDYVNDLNNALFHKVISKKI